MSVRCVCVCRVRVGPSVDVVIVYGENAKLGSGGA